MRLRGSTLALALALLLSAASPAAAADWGVSAIDFEFVPAEQRIAVGDSVTWSFTVAGHTSTSAKGQAESWTSVREGTNDAGTTFTKVFDTPGRYQYVCTPHQTFMKGVVQVGEDGVAKSVARLGSRRKGKRVTVSFTLREPARVTYALTGEARRRVARARLAKGKHSLVLRGLAEGSYRGVLTAVDDFDKKTTSRNSFAVR